MQRKILLAGLIINLLGFCPIAVLSKSKKLKPWTIDSPLKAIVFYFPSPPVMRCLNHSNVQGLYRKASVYRRATFPNKEVIEQSLVIGVNKAHKKFIFTGSIKTKSELIPMKIRGEIPFGLTGQKFDFGLFGLDNLLGLQKKIHVKDKIGDQRVDYETFLKSTKGRIGNQEYILTLHGEEKVGTLDQSLRYHLTGAGMLGNYNILVNAKDTTKDNYELIEKYGPVEIFTIIKVYD